MAITDAPVEAPLAPQPCGGTKLPIPTWRHPFLAAWLAGLGALSFALSWPQPGGVAPGSVLTGAALAFTAVLYGAWSGRDGTRAMPWSALCNLAVLAAITAQRIALSLILAARSARAGNTFAGRVWRLAVQFVHARNVWPEFLHLQAVGAGWAVLAGVAVPLLRAAMARRRGR